MLELLTAGFVQEQLQRLAAVWPQKGDVVARAAEYRTGLAGLSIAAVRSAVDRAIRECRYHPKPAELRAYAQEWTSANAPPVPRLAAGESEHTCPGCGQDYWVRVYWRPRTVKVPNTDDRRELELTADRTRVVMERFTKLGCACSVRPMYPEAGIVLEAFDMGTIKLTALWRCQVPLLPRDAQRLLAELERQEKPTRHAESA